MSSVPKTKVNRDGMSHYTGADTNVEPSQKSATPTNSA